MPHHVKYYDDIQVGFLFRVSGDSHHPVATFYPNSSGEDNWRFIVPPDHVATLLEHDDMIDAVRAFLETLGILELEVTVERV